MNPDRYLTRPVVTGLAALSGALAIWTATQIHLGSSSALRHIATAIVLLVAAVALWMLRPEDDDHAPRPPYDHQRPSLRERLSALTQPAPLPHRPYTGHGAPAPAPLPEPVVMDYPEPPAPTPEPPAPDFDTLFNRGGGR